MQFKLLALLAAAAGTALAQRPTNTSICDYYTTALLKQNTAENQYKLLTLLVNTAVIGNYTQPNHNAVAGILATGQTYNGTDVNLLQYFNGMLASTNTGGSKGVSQNFLDGGGAAPLKMNKPAMDTTSNQYMLLTHLYSFFGVLLGCTTYGEMGFPKYGGVASQYEVHKFMALDPYQVGYFIEQVGLSATSFGVTAEDAMAAGMAIGKLFDYRCSPPTTVIKEQGPQLQSICTDPSCPLDPNAKCSLEDNNGVVMMPANLTMGANGTMTSTNGSSSGSGSTMTPSATGSNPASFTAAAAKMGVASAAVIGAGVFALLM